MNRFAVFTFLNAIIKNHNVLINNINFLEVLSGQLNVYISSLYDPEHRNETRFVDLKLNNKILELPHRLYLKLQNDINNLIIYFNYWIKAKPINFDKTILFLPVTVNHLDQMIPVSNKMKEKKVKYLYITNKPLLINKLIKRGEVNILHFKHSNLPIKEINNKTNEIEVSINNLFSAFNYAFGEYNTQNIISYLFDHLSQFINFSNTYTALLSDNSIKGIIVGNDLTYEGRILTYIAQALKIPNFSIMHGSISGEPMDSKHIADTFFVYGNISKEYLVNIGNSPEKLFIGGAPYLDKYIHKISNCNINNKIKKIANTDNYQLHFLVVLSGPGHCTTFSHFNKIVNSIFQFAQINPEYLFIFKLHPKDSLNNYLKFVKNYKINNILIIEHGTKSLPDNIFDWMSGMDSIITGSSTVALEAMLNGTHVITIDYNKEYLDVDFIDQGYTIVANNENDFFNILYQFKHDKESLTKYLIGYKEYISNYFFAMGESANLICNTILNKIYQ